MAKLIGTDPNQVPTNGDLGDLAYQNKDSVKIEGGEITADSLTVDGGTGNYGIEIEARTDFTGISGQLGLTDDSGSAVLSTLNGNLNITTGATFGTTTGTQRLQIANNGDISFYEDTGTTPKFFWDASAESLGIGTSSPSYKLHSYSGANSVAVLAESSGSLSTISFKGSGSTTDYHVRVGTDGADYVAYTNNTERMRIDSNGRVGIGTTSPSEKLEVDGATGMRADGGGYLTKFLNSSSTSEMSGYIYDNNQDHLQITAYDASYDLSFGTNNAERMRIDSSGRVGINKTNPSAALHVVGNANPTSYFQVSGNGNQAIIFHNASAATAGYITVNASSVSYNTSSDYRLKTDVQPMTGATERLKALKPVNFEWIADGTRVDGFLAHEAQEVVPEAVIGTKDAMRTEEYEVTPAVLDDDGNVVTEAVMGEREVPDYQGIDQSKLVPLLVAAMQEQQAVIESLTARIEALEN
jgi:hypothetical protein